jgi:hypothetical protein
MIYFPVRLLPLLLSLVVIDLTINILFKSPPPITRVNECFEKYATELSKSSFKCVTGTPCDEYRDEVDFRIIVLTYDRTASMLKLLSSLNDLELDGDSAALEIWIDINKKGKAHAETVQAARSFTWTKGPTRVHVQTSHAGIAGQWIDTWRPKPNSRELAIILEDDLSVSPMAYRFVKGVHKAMANASNFVGVTIQSDELKTLSSRPKGPLAVSQNDTAFMYKCFGTWGFSPKPDHWRRFQVGLRLICVREQLSMHV